MEVNELVSVIVPIYNVEDTLERCIDSILQDKYEEQRQNFVDEIGYCKEPGPEIIADRVLEVIEER